MNVKELIEKYEYLNHNCFRRVDTSEVLRDLKQLDEPEKVTIPQFVADVIEEAREKSAELEDAFEYVWEVAIGELQQWFRKLENRDNFARAWLDGYELEKEKRYLVKVKALETSFSFLNLNKAHNHWLFSSKSECDIFQVYHTRKELEEAGFGWVFDCPGIEIKEVE